MLLAFEESQIEHFVTAFLGPRAPEFLRALGATPLLPSLARIPLLLALLCATFGAETSEALPGERAKIYSRCLRQLLVRHERSGAVRRRDHDIDPWFDLLPELAWLSFVDGRDQLPTSYLGEILARLAGTLPPSHRLRRDSASLIDELLAHGLLITTGVGDGAEVAYAFLHRTFQEYLAARWLAERSVVDWEAVASILERRSWDPRFEQVIVLLCGVLADDDVPLIDGGGHVTKDKRICGLFRLLALLAGGADDVSNHRLALAALATAEIPRSLLEG